MFTVEIIIKLIHKAMSQQFIKMLFKYIIIHLQSMNQIIVFFLTNMHILSTININPRLIMYKPKLR